MPRLIEDYNRLCRQTEIPAIGSFNRYQADKSAVTHLQDDRFREGILLLMIDYFLAIDAYRALLHFSYGFTVGADHAGFDQQRRQLMRARAFLRGFHHGWRS